MSNNPLVSICIPTYNGEEFLEEALESVSAQTYHNLEIVVSDDASSDDTLDIVEDFKKKTSIPIHVYHHKPQGIGANWNNCIKKANGDYIKFLFQDDLLKSTCIEEMMRLAIKHPMVGLVYCRREILYSQENRFVKTWLVNFSSLHESWASDGMTREVVNGREMLKDKKLLLPPQNKIGEPTAVLLNKRMFEAIGFFNERLKQALDIEYWYRLMTKFDVGFVDLELVSFRLHEKQASQVNNSKNIDDKHLLSLILLRTIYFYVDKSQKLYILSEIKLYKKVTSLIKRVKNKVLWR